MDLLPHIELRSTATVGGGLLSLVSFPYNSRELIAPGEKVGKDQREQGQIPGAPSEAWTIFRPRPPSLLFLPQQPWRILTKNMWVM